MSEHTKLLRLTGIAIFGALCYVMTMFCQIPYAGGAGYFNFGDLVTLFVSMAFGPIEGALVGMIGGSMADISSGFAAYAPFTLVAKGLMGLVSGLLFILMKKRSKWLRFVSPFIGATFMIATYMVAYAILIGEGVIISSAFDCVQGYGSAICSILIYIAVAKTGVIEKLNGKPIGKSADNNDNQSSGKQQ